MSIYLHSVEIKNFRQFLDRRFEFKPGFNLLVGENGTGKTTILRGVRAALGTIHRAPKGVRIEDTDIGINDRILSVEAEVKGLNHLPSFFKINREWGKGRSNRSGSKNHPLTLFYSSYESVCAAMKGKTKARTPDFREFSAESAEEYLYRTAFKNIFNSEETDASSGSRFGDSKSVRQFVEKVLSKFSEDISQFGWRFVPYDCEIVFPKEISAEMLPSREFLSLLQSFALRWFEEEAAFRRSTPFAWPDAPKVTLAPGYPRKDIRLPELRELWREARNDFKISASLSDLLNECLLEVKLTPRITFQRGNIILGLDQLSEGEKRLFTLFVDIARQLSIRHQNSDFGHGEAIILIDEIDVHLHPKWQRLVVPSLEDLFPNCQFIATTHSPFVIQATSREKVILIDQIVGRSSLNGGNSIEDIIEQIQGVHKPQRSMRAEKLSRAARKYFSLLESHGEDSTEIVKAELLEAESSYREASEPFSSNPAVHALLRTLAVEGGGDK